MSGGSMNYLYNDIECATFELNTPERRAFSAHLKKVAKALHDIEWVDSGDYKWGDETEAIMACISDAAVIDVSIARAIEASEELRELIERYSDKPKIQNTCRLCGGSGFVSPEQQCLCRL